MDMSGRERQIWLDEIRRISVDQKKVRDRELLEQFEVINVLKGEHE